VRHMLPSARFQHEVFYPIKRLLDAQGLRPDDELLMRILESTGNYMACLPGLDEAKTRAVWYEHSIEAMGGS
jgi:hypothetical protein